MTITNTWERRSGMPTRLVVSAGPSFRDEHRARMPSRRVRVMAVLVPALFVVGVEVLGYLGLEYDVVEERHHPLTMVVLGLMSCAAVLAFAGWIFAVFERTQRDLVRQNRRLAAVNAVATSVQGRLGVEDVVDTLAWRVLQTTGAHELTVTVFQPEAEPGQDSHVLRWTASDDVAVHVAATRVVDVPLETGSAAVGWMRLRLPASRLEDVFDADTLRSLAHILGAAVQTEKLLADLQRRNRDDFALYDLLRQVPGGRPAVDVLAEVVQRARHMLAAEEVVLTLDEEGRAWLSGAVDLTGTAPASPRHIASGGPLTPDASGDEAVRAIRSSDRWRQTMTFAIRGQTGGYGDLWVARSEPEAFTPHDRSCMEALAGIAGLVVANARSRQNEQAAVVLEERERIAREMHDSLAQVFGAGHLKLRAIEPRVRDSGLDRVADDVAGLADMCSDAYRDVREAILGLHMSSRHDAGFVAGVRAYLAKYCQQSGVDAELTTDLTEDAGFAPGAEVQMIRVIQEALTNVRKHSHASRVVVRLSHDGHTARFSVTDNGRGFDLPVDGFAGDGFGMFTMRDRMAKIGGCLTVESVPGLGTTVQGSVPTPLRRPAVSRCEEGVDLRG